MRPGVRSKLFLVSLSLIVLVGSASALYLEWSLRGFLEERVQQQLVEHARSVRATLQLGTATSTYSLDRLVARLSAATSARITVIGPNGVVRADSNVAFQDLPTLDNHGSRPEVRAAQEADIGVARRFSDTLSTNMLYVATQLDPAALPDEEGDGASSSKRGERGSSDARRRAMVRVAMPLSAVDAVISRLRLLLGLAGVFGLVLATLMSLLASHLLSRTLRRLVDHARVVLSGHGHRIDIFSSDEIGRLAGSFNELAAGLEETMAALALERARFEAILDSMSEAVLVLDERQRILLVNPETLRLLGLKVPPVGQPLLDTIELPELYELAKVGARGRAQSELSVNADKPRAVLARATPLRESGGTVIVMHDVTEVRRLENIRKDFVANVSHELRTPVSIVQANAETLLDGALEDPVRARTFVEALHRNAERLSRIIADLLDLSRLEAGRYRFEITSVDVGETVAHAVEAVEAKAGERNQSIEISVPDGQEVLADAKALEQVLTNLLENSIKYTPDGGHVAVRAEERSGEVRLEVQDDGPGIKPEHRARIFERFYRIDPGRSRDMGGTGLGLAIVKHFVESMGGRVGVDPAFPRGSIFWVTLPVGSEESLDEAV